MAHPGSAADWISRYWRQHRRLGRHEDMASQNHAQEIQIRPASHPYHSNHTGNTDNNTKSSLIVTGFIFIIAEAIPNDRLYRDPHDG